MTRQLDSIAELVAHLGDEALPACLTRVLGDVCAFDGIVVFDYRRSEPPVDLYDDLDPTPREITVTAYQAGAYLLDPFYHAHLNGVASGLYRLRDLAPSRFLRTAYYETYYQRIGLIDELGFFAHLAEDRTIVVSIGRRKPAAAFRRAEIAGFRAIEPVIRAAVIQHWGRLIPSVSADKTVADEAVASDLQQARSSGFNPALAGLTERETQVANLILRGYSSEAIGLTLDIRPSTVKVHRKHLYKKLQISSQAELFALFLESLSGVAYPQIARPGR